MEPCSPQELVVPDENAEKLAERRAELEKRKAEMREQLKRGMDVVERMAEENE
mgnify:CR=1 FL=1